MNLRKKIFILVLVTALFTLFAPFSVNFSPSDLNQPSHFVGLDTKNPRALASYKSGAPTAVTKALTGENGSGKWIITLYNTCKGFMNVLLLVALLIAAFANILHLPIESYTIKKILPQVLFVAVFANLALPIFAILSRVIDNMQGLELFKPTIVNMNFFSAGGTASATSIVATILGLLLFFVPGLSCLGGIVTFIFVFVPTIIVVLFHLILAFRPWVIFLSVAVAPLAIGCSILPQTEQYFKKWVGIIVPWFFLPIIGYAIVNIGQKIPVSVGVAGVGAVSQIIGIALPIALRAGLLLLVIRFPFTIEKDISSLVAAVGKGAWDKTKAIPGYIGSLRKNQAIKDWNLRDPKKATSPFQKLQIGAAKKIFKVSEFANNGLPVPIPYTGIKAVIPLAQLSNLSQFWKERTDLAKKRELEAAQGGGGAAPISKELLLRFLMEDDATKYRGKPIAQLDSVIGYKVVDGKNVEDPEGKLFKYRQGFEKAIREGRIAGIDLEGIMENAGFDKKRDPDTLNAEQMERLYHTFLGDKFAQSDSKSGWYNGLTKLGVGSSGKEMDEFKEFILALQAKAVAVKTRITPRKFADDIALTDEERDAMISRRLKGNISDGSEDADASGEEGGGASGDPVGGVEEGDLGRASKMGVVDLSPVTIGALSAALATANAIKSDPDKLASTMHKELTNLSKSLRDSGMDKEDVDKLSDSVSQGQIRSEGDMAKLLPQRIADRSGDVYKRFARIELMRSMALAKASKSPEAANTILYAQRMASNIEEIMQSSNGGRSIYEAADKIAVHEYANANPTDAEAQRFLLSEQDLSASRKIVAEALKIPEATVDAKIASGTARGLEAMQSGGGQKGLTEAAARQVIRDELLKKTSVDIFDALGSASFHQKPIPAEQVVNITNNITEAVDLQTKILPPEISQNISSQQKEIIAQGIVANLTSKIENSRLSIETINNEVATQISSKLGEIGGR
jgi:hypothetical protein